MEYHIHPISGNSFKIELLPVTIKEQTLLQQNTDKASIQSFYEHALKLEFDRHVHVSSITPNVDFPYSATVEVFVDQGST